MRHFNPNYQKITQSKSTKKWILVFHLTVFSLSIIAYLISKEPFALVCGLSFAISSICSFVVYKDKESDK